MKLHFRLHLIFVLFILAGCYKKSEAPPVVVDIKAKLKSCLPDYKKNNITSNDTVLKVKKVTSDYQGTTLTIDIRAGNEPLNFNMPVYSLSKGRWLINPDDINGKNGDKGRTYLLDTKCREHKLKDRTSSKEVSKNGLLKLKVGQTYEVSLLFTPLSPNIKEFLFVYGDRVLMILRM